MMKSCLFQTASLLFLISGITAGDPGKCIPANSSPAFAKTSEAWFGIRDTYSLLVNAMLHKGPSKDQAISGAKWQLDNVEKLSAEAKLLIAKDESSLRRQFYLYRLDKLSVKATAARLVLKVGIPTWPTAGKAILKAHEFWGGLKKKLKKVFNSDSDNGTINFDNDDDDDDDDDGDGKVILSPPIPIFDPNFQGQFAKIVDQSSQTLEEIKDITKELKTSLIC